MGRNSTVLKAFATGRTRLLTRDAGVTAVEYGLLVALVVAVVFVVAATLGHRVSAAGSCLKAGAS